MSVSGRTHLSSKLQSAGRSSGQLWSSPLLAMVVIRIPTVALDNGVRSLLTGGDNKPDQW